MLCIASADMLFDAPAELLVDQFSQILFCLLMSLMTIYASEEQVPQ